MARWRLRRGITRVVVLTRRWAIKVPTFRPYGEGLAGMLWGFCRGVLANQSEATWWRNSPDTQRRHLCPVRHSWLGGIINIYPRCEPYEVGDSTRIAMFERLDFPIPDLVPQLSDNKPENYGWLNNRLVAVDYDMGWNGCPHDRSGVLNRIEENDPESAPYARQLAAYRGEHLRDRERLAALMDWCAYHLGNSFIHQRIRFFLGVPDDAFPWQLDSPEKIEVIDHVG